MKVPAASSNETIDAPTPVLRNDSESVEVSAVGYISSETLLGSEASVDWTSVGGTLPNAWWDQVVGTTEPAAEMLSGTFTVTLGDEAFSVELTSAIVDDAFSGELSSVLDPAGSSSWITRFTNAVVGFGSLDSDWFGGDVAAPNGVAINAATGVLERLWNVEIEPARVDPSPEEGVSIGVAVDSGEIVVECFNSGELLVTDFRGGDPVVDHFNHENELELWLEETLSTASLGPSGEDVLARQAG